ncbi:hypothetical protein AB0E85_28675 [Streptomyces sp. NPDC029044]|uniref:hypothetical protein n=1 Tax=Streptomyces sp. NPDC029044 TaxID=3157198 RepID=UPI0033FB4AFC
MRGLFDDVVGSGGVLLLADLGWKVVALDAVPGEEQVVDTTGAYAAWLAQLDAVAVLIRPDFYVYGTAIKRCNMAISSRRPMDRVAPGGRRVDTGPRSPSGRRLPCTHTP